MQTGPGRRTRGESRITADAIVFLALAAITAPSPAAPLREAPESSSAADLVRRPSAPNERIRHLAQQVRLTRGGTKARLERIIDQIFSEKTGLAFTYRARPTLTAAEAVEARAGNCLTLVNLVVSIAREAGLDAEFVEVDDFETFYRQRGTVVRTTHVIAGIDDSGQMLYVDFLPYREKPYRQLRPISDRRAAALFYNALAADAILADDYVLAARHFEEALAVDEDSADTWNNYAILQRRQGDLQGAIASLERARRIDPRALPPIENLAGIHRRLGRIEEAEAFETMALEEKTRNPFFLLQQAIEQLEKNRFEEAEDLLKRARRLAPDEPEIYVVLGRVALARGSRQEANQYFDLAGKKSKPRAEGFQRLLQNKIDRLLAASEEAAPEGSEGSPPPGENPSW